MFAETASRPGVLGLPGQRIEKLLAKDLKTYYRELAPLVETAGTEHDVQVAVNRKRPTLQFALRSALEQAYTMATLLKTTDKVQESSIIEADQDIDKLGDLGQKAANWAENQAAKLVVGLDKETVSRIADTIAEGIEQRLGSAGTAKLIRQELKDMEVSRAITIAATEINNAMSQATLDKLGALEIEYKQWILDADPCEICIGNADQGAIPVNEPFESGDMAPAAHPNCRCAIAGAREPE